MKLQGKRVLIDKPEVPKLKVELSESDLRAHELKIVEKFKRLKVFAVGTDCVSVKEGQEVYITGTNLSRAELIELEDKTVKYLVNENEIAIIY